MTRLEISKVPASRHSNVAEKIEDALLSSLAEMNEQSVNSSVVMQVTDKNDRLIAGVTGATSYGWFLIKTLWVGETHRRSGFGTQLMSAAEDEARRLGCHSAWLDTSTSEAREFYLQLGYADFGVLKNGAENEPTNHSRWFMQKSL
ncbi:hypothetical protein NBRC116594_37400 [Shimia sp. NS0008-38b]|uniref:GNAT family N-acetyltransferase n=1 Tax=Shimia sp. NS0008-38b TaxID=3127653 RepID=UPI0031048618